jgi:hypothetical protein
LIFLSFSFSFLGNTIRVGLGTYSPWIDSIANCTSVVTATGFHHIVVTRISNTMSAYLDGSLSCSSSFVNNNIQLGVSGGITIGKGSQSGDRFNGLIGGYSIWSRGLSSSEVSSLYQIASTPTACYVLNASTQQCGLVTGIQNGC